jgi:hypothetical protein
MESVTGTAECRVHDAQVKYIAINKEEPTAVSHNPTTSRFKGYPRSLSLSNREFQHSARTWRRESKRHLFVVDSLDKHMQNAKELIRLRRFMPAARTTRARH